MKKKVLIDGLPVDFVKRLEIQFPCQFHKIMKSFHQRPPVIRANTLLTKIKSLQISLKKQGIESENILLLPNALVITNVNRRTLTETKEYKDGLFYIQSIASQLIVKALNPQAGEDILDLCSAPGSKTTQIAIEMCKKGKLLANDNNRKRLYRLKANLKHQKVDDFVEVKNYSGQNYPKFYPNNFDRILVDVPCSSEARFNRRYPKSIKYWSRHKVRSFSKLNKRLLDAAVKCLKEGGTIVYSTCTLSPEENEIVLDTVLKKHPSLQIQPIDWDIKTLPIITEWRGKELNADIRNALRIFPDEKQEAFFLCKLKKE